MVKKTLMLILGLFFSESCSDQKKNSEIEVYNQVLDHLLSERYLNGCLDLSEDDLKFQDNYFSGKINAAKFQRYGDSIRERRKSQSPKCILDYSNIFFASPSSDTTLEGELQQSIQRELTDKLVDFNFENSMLYSIVDTLSRVGTIGAADLSVDYLQIIAHPGFKASRFGKQIGVLTFSKIFFNDSRDKGIVYYEFVSNPLNGIGELLLLTKKSEKWIIMKRKNIWQS